jgi:phospholipid transport system substrate-binding protein
MFPRQALLVLFVSAIVGLASVPGHVVAGPPTDQLRESVDAVLKTLESPDGDRERNVSERRTAIRKTASSIFDFEESARRALGRHWQARTPRERAEFVRLFTDLLEHTYLGQIEQYSGEGVSYVGESIDGDQAIVRTKIITKQGTEVPVDYRMRRAGDRWQVYDVVIEGLSLIANYRSQFNRIIRTSSYEDLVTRLRAKELSPPPSGRQSSRASLANAP